MNIEDFHGIDCEILYKEINKKYGLKTVEILKANSPDSHRNRKTPYRLGWETKEKSGKHYYRVTVWNKTNWQLTHLLENGHFITNKLNGIGWARSNPHIHQAFNAVEPKYVSDMRKAEIDVKLY